MNQDPDYTRSNVVIVQRLGNAVKRADADEWSPGMSRLARLSVDELARRFAIEDRLDSWLRAKPSFTVREALLSYESGSPGKHLVRLFDSDRQMIATITDEDKWKAIDIALDQIGAQPAPQWWSRV